MTKIRLQSSFLHFQEVADEVNSNVHFFKLHAPWPILCKYAEELNLRAPLQVNKNNKKCSKIWCFYIQGIKFRPCMKTFLKFTYLQYFTFRLILTPQSIGQSGFYLNCKKFFMLFLQKVIIFSSYVPNPMSEEVPNKPLDYYTCPFKMSKLDR